MATLVKTVSAPATLGGAPSVTIPVSAISVGLPQVLAFYSCIIMRLCSCGFQFLKKNWLFTFALIGPSKGINSGKCQRHGRHPATTKAIHHSTSSSSSTTEDTTATATQSRSTCSNSDLRNYQRKRSECPPAARYCRRHSSIGSTCCKWQRIWNQWNCCR